MILFFGFGFWFLLFAFWFRGFGVFLVFVVGLVFFVLWFDVFLVCCFLGF